MHLPSLPETYPIIRRYNDLSICASIKCSSLNIYTRIIWEWNRYENAHGDQIVVDIKLSKSEYTIKNIVIALRMRIKY